VSAASQIYSRRLAFPGDCSKKTGADPSEWDADYVDHLGASFEWQTWVYEQAVSQLWVTLLIVSLGECSQQQI
jgi:hypothetical protein